MDNKSPMPKCCGNVAASPAADLFIIGGGSAAFAAATRAVELGAHRVVIANDRLPIGGTCVNVGCVPSKTLIRAAEAVHRSRHSAFAGIETAGRVTNFAALMAEKRQLVAGLRQAKYEDVVGRLPALEVMTGRAQLLDRHTVLINGKPVKAGAVVIATGAAPAIPKIPGLLEPYCLTNESAFELNSLPESLIVLGGRYIALECAQMFARLGSRVTVLQRSERILPTESDQISGALTECLAAEGITLHTAIALQSVVHSQNVVHIKAQSRGRSRDFIANQLLVATGRKPNTANMGLEALGVRLDSRGFVEADETLQTSVPGVWAAGDVLGRNMFVYAAAYEGAIAAENALTGKSWRADYTALPWVIFTDPQVAGVGMDERQALAEGYQAQAATLPLRAVPRAIAAHDTRGLITLIRDKTTDQLLGARIVAAEGSELLMEAALAIKFGITIQQIRESFHPYLTLGEGIKLAAIAFDKNVSQLSCCAT